MTLPTKAKKGQSPKGPLKAKKKGKKLNRNGVKKAEVEASEPWKEVKLQADLEVKAKMEGLLGIETLKNYKMIKKTQKGNPKVLRKFYSCLFV